MRVDSEGVRHWSVHYHDEAAMPAVVCPDVEEVTMSATTRGAESASARRRQDQRLATKGPARLRSSINAGVHRLA
jgi:hypothetical protein